MLFLNTLNTHIKVVNIFSAKILLEIFMTNFQTNWFFQIKTDASKRKRLRLKLGLEFIRTRSVVENECNWHYICWLKQRSKTKKDVVSC